jgi:predicted Rossmann fold flavoprotein
LQIDVIIIGAGAAGLMCAIEAAKRSRSVLVVERAEKIGKKILISGGGRCNFTNIHTKPENFISENPHFCKSALSRYTPNDFIQLIEKHKIKYHEKKLGQLFCDKSAKDIVDMLKNECDEYGVEILLNCDVTHVNKSDKFVLKSNKGVFESDSLVVSTGGISIPQMGATDFGYKLAKQFGIKLTRIVPALVPFTLKEKQFAAISGVSVDAVVSCNGVSFKESILFTHKGLSGPAILQISSYWNSGDKIIINLLPDIDVEMLINKNKSSKMMFDNFLSQFMPKRFTEVWCDTYFKPKPLNKLTDKEIENLTYLLHNWELIPSGTEGFGKAEVTKGGIDTNELSSKSMESKKVKGLYFIGEAVDVTGWLGGYNFQWALSSGFAVGEFV